MRYPCPTMRLWSLASLVAVAGCEMPLEPPPPSGFTVERIEIRHAVALAGDGKTLAPGERETIAAFLAENRSGTPFVTVEASGPGAAAEQALVIATIERSGRSATNGNIASGTINGATIVVTKDAYVPNACERAAPQTDDTLRPPACTLGLGLAQMVDNPADLVSGRSPGPAPAGPIGRAALRYLQVGGQTVGSDVSTAPSSTSTSAH